MNIGIVSSFNPHEILPYLNKGQEIPNINKAATAVNIIVKELLEQGHQVTIFTSYPKKGGIKVLKGNNITIYLVSREKRIPKTGLFIRLYMVRRLINMMKTRLKGIEILHAHWTYEYALAAKYFSKKMPVFCTVRDWCPYIYSCQKGFKNKLHWKVNYYIFKKVMKGNNIHFIANSSYTYTQIKNQYPEKKISIIPNPIDKQYILKERNYYPKNEIFISISQGIDIRKNLERLLEAFYIYHKQAPSSRLMLVGRDFVNNNSHVLRWEAKGYLDGVELHGWVDHEQLMTLLDSVSALVHPSLEETFGNILLEGMARRIPVIGGIHSGAVPKVLGDGEYGILCDVSDAKSICSAMFKLNNKNLVHDMINRSTKYIINCFQSDIIAKKHIELYNIFLNK